MSSLAIFSVKYPALFTILAGGSTVLSIFIIFALTFSIVCHFWKHEHSNVPFGAWIFSSMVIIICLFTFANTNDTIQGVARYPNGAKIKISQDHQFIFTFLTYKEETKGQDLDGNIITESKAIENTRVILCKKNNKNLDYNECWNMLKDKSVEELIAISIDPKSISKSYSLSN